MTRRGANGNEPNRVDFAYACIFIHFTTSLLDDETFDIIPPEANMGEFSKILPPDLKSVRINAGFWSEKQSINREATLPAEYGHLEATHRLDSINGDWSEQSGYMPHVFWDSDIAKWIEAAAYSLCNHPDADLEEKCDEAIDKFARLQLDDGYLNSFFIQVEPESRWTDLHRRHELYCAGHLIEAAVAYFEATGKTKFLDVMSKYADYIASVFGPEPDKKKGYPGHEEIELALVKLARVTGEKRYLDLSKYFIDQRGTRPHYYHEEAIARGDKPEEAYDYLQAHAPVREQQSAEGHSVRACYLYAGMADIARETGDDQLKEACLRIWRNIVEKRMYIHGGIGSSAVGERFTVDYDLPNEEAYAETCAAIALVFFAHRMFLLDPRSEYIDVVERALYNGVLSGVSEDGKRFFYDNYLASFPGYHEIRRRSAPERQDWFGCACCPPNLARIIASIENYLFATSDDSIYINLYAQYEAEITLSDSLLRFSMVTDYPWNGDIRITMHPEGAREIALKLRLPGWCSKSAALVNGDSVETAEVDGYLVIHRSWVDGDTIDVVLEMPVERIVAHPSVRHNVGKFAIQRGPIVYCIEEADNGADLNNLFVSQDADLVVANDENLLGGTVKITGTGLARRVDGWSGSLYRPGESEHSEERRFTAIPYHAWNNRGAGEMTVWVNSVIKNQ